MVRPGYRVGSHGFLHLVILVSRLLIGFLSLVEGEVLAWMLKFIDQFETFTLTLVLKLTIVIRVVGVIGSIVDGTF